MRLFLFEHTRIELLRRRKIRSETFQVEGRQEDAEEFLSCLLDGLHDEMIEVMKFSEDEGAASKVGGFGEKRPNPTTDEEDWQVII